MLGRSLGLRVDADPGCQGGAIKIAHRVDYGAGPERDVLSKLERLHTSGIPEGMPWRRRYSRAVSPWAR